MPDRHDTSAPRRWHSLREYDALRAVLQTGTTAEAARRLGLSQSAVSRSISNLEARQSVTLFTREAGRLQPTQEAVRLNLRLDPLFEALSRIDGPEENVQETLRLIAPPSYAHRFLVEQIGTFLKANRSFFVSLEVASSDDLAREIIADRFDLGLIGTELTRADLKQVPFRQSSAVCVMAAGHPLAGRSVVTPADLDGQDLIALAARHARRGQLERVLARAGATPRIVAEVTTSFAAADLAGAGLGLSVVNPFPLHLYRSRDLAFVPFDSPIRYRTHFVISSRRPLPRIARAFIRHLRLHTPTDPYSRQVERTEDRD
ncbi:LysR family transcriptional regulator [Jannaschia sp. S6380]|uniref:LysR family transcriptional regulator n=1 Tax=Jannaschia sp. S6380 TaxID=2926408 RepID=UPI001FF1F667|nr:LysR family transcriptional regulator [Jannaschia sp. S6380]MCK0166778.1 LysR family transcriptional regulator [Jannaschia sp. S6380]